MTIFDTLDYREYLKDYYAIRKAERRYFSYKMFASAVCMDQSHLAKILMGHMHLPVEKIDAFCDYLHLEGAEALYFEALVHFGRANTVAEADIWFEKLQKIRPPQYRILPREQLEYFAHWYVPAVRALAGCLERDDATQIAALLDPSVPLSAVESSLTVLFRLGLVEKMPDGKLRLHEAHLGSGRSVGLVSEASAMRLRNYHREVLEIAMDALENVPPVDRDVSSLTVAIDRSAFEDIRALAREFRKAVQKRIDQVTAADRVYHINLQMVPVSHCSSDKEHL
ncbi:MAG: TIGR02147 family protein [Fibrobacteraceae bacterium]|nr:TIGR02147 family protein [Fibrobacteraceae bacterium]